MARTALAMLSLVVLTIPSAARETAGAYKCSMFNEVNEGVRQDTPHRERIAAYCKRYPTKSFREAFRATDREGEE